MKQILTKAFIVPFYKAFLGFFLLLILIFGIFIKAEVHIMLGYQIIQSTYALLGLITLFSLYSLLHWNFQRKLLIQSNYKIFHSMGLFNPRSFYKVQFNIWLGNHAIVILYTAFLSSLCFDLKLWGTFTILWGLLIALYFIYSSLIFYQLRNPLAEIKVKRSAIGKSKSFKIVYHLWFLYHLKENRSLLLLACKLVSLLLLNLFFSTYQNGDYDYRWLQFAILCVSFVNLPLLKEKRDFEKSSLTYFLNMPISFLKKCKSHFLQIFLIILPEVIFIFYQITTTDLSFDNASLSLLICALNLGLYGLFNHIDNANKLSKYTLLSFFLLFFSVLYGFPTYALTLAALLLFFTSLKSPFKN